MFQKIFNIGSEYLSREVRVSFADTFWWDHGFRKCPGRVCDEFGITLEKCSKQGQNTLRPRLGHQGEKTICGSSRCCRGVPLLRQNPYSLFLMAAAVVTHTPSRQTCFEPVPSLSQTFPKITRKHELELQDSHYTK